MGKIKHHLKSHRYEFTIGILDEKSCSKSPFRQFEKWMQEAISRQVHEPNAMTLATTDSKGIVDSRIVLLRGIDKMGFAFYTNYKSGKGKEMSQNRRVCLNFFWPELQRQVRIRGKVEKLSTAASDRYFASRPRESQIGAWASLQSQVLTDRVELDERYIALTTQYEGKKIPRPAHWGGYRVLPLEIEFWQGRQNRLHDRLLFTKAKNGTWERCRLNP